MTYPRRHQPAVATAAARPLVKMRVGLLLALAALFLAACASGPSLRKIHDGLPPPRDGQGRIYFYRAATPLLVALEPQVIVNGKLVGASRPGSVFYRDALPGRYEVFLASDRNRPVSFDLGAGQARFVKTIIDFGIAGVRLSARLVEEATAREEIADLSFIEGARVD